MVYLSLSLSPGKINLDDKKKSRTYEENLCFCLFGKHTDGIGVVCIDP